MKNTYQNRVALILLAALSVLPVAANVIPVDLKAN